MEEIEHLIVDIQKLKKGGKIMKKPNYSILIGLGKTAKNSAYLLVPFFIAVISGLPKEYAWIIGPIIYMLKNYLANRK